MNAATYLQELLLEDLVRLPKESQENSPCHPIEAHPQFLSRVLSLKEVEEDVHRRRIAKMVAKDTESPHKGPAVRVQMGKGHVDLSKESALEPRKGKAELDLLEDGDVHEEEGLFGVRAIARAHENASHTRQNL